ncbi:stage II sporulation protein M [Halovivax sp.]|uniref:stage II sporulation protein M n=1 Tax=Halovivax sp. TaxID=1935978 RepID=UPI0025BCBE5F|nr:stage II sporulation protein M [Halovivax sp.]
MDERSREDGRSGSTDSGDPPADRPVRRSPRVPDVRGDGSSGAGNGDGRRGDPVDGRRGDPGEEGDRTATRPGTAEPNRPTADEGEASEARDDRIPIDPSLDLDVDAPDRVGDEPPERDPPPSAPGFDADPDPETVRRWAALLSALGVVSFLTALLVQFQGELPAALGAAGLGVVFLATGLFGLRERPELLQLLADGWAEHRRYVGFTVALFAFGAAVGLAIGAAGYDVLELIAEALGEHPFEGIEEEDLTAEWFLRNNSVPFLMAIAGAITLGILTAYILVFNGIIVGNVAWVVGGVVGADFIVVGLAPHGIFELTALFIAAGVGFRLLHRFGQRVLGRRESFATKPYLVRTALLVVFAWLLLALAAFVEAHVTGIFLDALFADRIDERADALNETASAVVAALF